MRFQRMHEYLCTCMLEARSGEGNVEEEQLQFQRELFIIVCVHLKDKQGVH